MTDNNDLQAFLEAPHQLKPGTTMPDLLADFEPARKKKVAEALTHYLVSSRNSGPLERETR